MPRYDHESIAFLRQEGLSWPEIAGRLGVDTDNLRKAYSRWRLRQPEEKRPKVIQEWRRESHGTVHYKYPDPPVDEEAIKQIWRDFLEDAEAHRPRYDPPPVVRPDSTDPMLAVLNLYDSHFGLRADIRETGQPSQDIDTISDEWRAAVDHLAGMAQLYPVEKWLVPLGHDIAHYDHVEGKTGVTKAGTPQDFDSRPHKIFTAIRRASVYLIDALRSTGKPVDVVMVHGNHDTETSYKLGDALYCWYRGDEHVSITNNPRLRHFYGWGRNAWMLYHGEFMLKKTGDAIPPLVFATECPADIWVASEGGSREILSGHLHARRQGRYTPTSDVDESRGIIARSLPGLTSTDAWHASKGYLHKRAATLLVYKKSGGLHALHEVNP